MRNVIRLCTISLFTLLLLTSCYDVFYSGISGTVYDADNRSTGLSGVQVYGYTSESARDAAYSGYQNGAANSRYKTKDGDFRDKDCLYRAATNAQGNWSIAKVVWNTNDSAWGKDYDHTSIYLIYFSEDIGIRKSEAPVEIISSASNSNAVSEYFEKIMKSHDVTVSFKDGTSGDNISDNVTLTYSYFNGYVTKSNQVTVTGGSFSVVVTALKTMDGVTAAYPELKLSDIDIVDRGWSIDTTEKTIAVDKDSVVQDYELTKLKTDFNVTVNFKEGSTNKNLQETFTMKYSYPVETGKTRTDEVTVSGGVFRISMSINLGDIPAPVLTLDSFYNQSGCLEEVDGQALDGAVVAISLDPAKKDVSKDYAVTRGKYDLGTTGFSGVVNAPKNKVFNATGELVQSLDNLNVAAVIGAGEPIYVTTGSADYSGEFARTFSSRFSDLADNIKVPASTTITFYVLKEGESVQEAITNGDALVTRIYTIDDIYSRKNELILNFD